MQFTGCIKLKWGKKIRLITVGEKLKLIQESQKAGNRAIGPVVGFNQFALV